MIRLFLVLLLAAEMSAKPTSIELIPENRLGFRGQAGALGEIGWKEKDIDWVEKAPVCRVVEKKKDPAFIEAFAKKHELKRQAEWSDDIGPRSDGLFVFEGESRYQVAAFNQTSHYTVIGLKSIRDNPRDAQKKPLISGVPGVRESARIAKGLLDSLGVNKEDLYFSPRDKDYPHYTILYHTLGYYDPSLRKTVEDNFAVEVRFSQQIGGLPAFWNGFGGCVRITLADKGEFAIARHCLRSWEVIDDYPVLGKNDLTKALENGFWWSGDAVRTESFEVEHVELSAYQANHSTPQATFPLLYVVTGRVRVDPHTTIKKTILVPALKEHRQKYNQRD